MIITANAPTVEFTRMGSFTDYAVADAAGTRIGTVTLRRGFAHYTGAKRSVHEGVTAVVADGLEGLRTALAKGLRSGHDDRDNGV